MAFAENQSGFERRFSLLLIIVILLHDLAKNSSTTHVKVYHFTIDYWRLSVEGNQNCGTDLICDWTYTDNLKYFKQKYRNSTAAVDVDNQFPSAAVIDVSVYNIHSWYERTKEHSPAFCEVPTLLTLAESEESRVRYHGMFDASFKNFDGYSTTHPHSNVQRAYESAFLKESQFINDGKMHNFSSLIKAASYVAGDCHRRDNANSNRDHVVYEIRKAGFRVEGLGRCMHSVNPEGEIDLFFVDLT